MHLRIHFFSDSDSALEWLQLFWTIFLKFFLGAQTTREQKHVSVGHESDQVEQFHCFRMDFLRDPPKNSQRRQFLEFLSLFPKWSFIFCQSIFLITGDRLHSTRA